MYIFLLAAGVAYFTATFFVFFKDVAQIVSIILQMLFWFTPIVWDESLMPGIVQKILPFNPLYYAVNGYRNVFIYKQLTNQSIYMVMYYWVFVITLVCFGVKLFNKCKDHFADIL